MTSATGGWAAGGTTNGPPLLLHDVDGNWQRVSPPGGANVEGLYTSLRMRGPDEGWLVLSGGYGAPSATLFHYLDGVWSQVSGLPLTLVNDVRPDAVGEVWLVGAVTNTDVNDTFAHYTTHGWTTFPAPAQVGISELSVVSPTDIWATGQIPGPVTARVQQRAVQLHHDGAQWSLVRTGADPSAQFLYDVVGGSDAWAFTLRGADRPAISNAHHLSGGQWQNVSWPFSGIELIGQIVLVSPGTYWAEGFAPLVRNEQGSAGSVVIAPRSVLLYYVDGAWHEIGQA